MTKVYKSNFIFVADRYEEWQAQRCINQGPIDTTIIAEVDGDNIHFELDEIQHLRIIKSFDFEISNNCVLSDRVQYTHSTFDLNPIIPMVCHIFYRGDNIEYVRFAMTNPNRLIEFYGCMKKLGQPSTGRRTDPVINNASAQSILQDMSSYGILKANAVFERGANLHNEVSSSEVCTIKGGKKIIESLKLLIKALDLDEEESKMKGRGTSGLKPKILEFIASCNYRLGNINNAYCVAKQGLVAVDKAIESSSFVGLPRNMYGADAMENLISLIESSYDKQIEDKDDIWAVEPSEIRTDIFDRFVKSSIQSKDELLISPGLIENMIKVIRKLQENLIEYGKKTDNTLRFSFSANIFGVFLYPLFYFWENMHYGHHSDFFNEGDSMFEYEMFEVNIQGNVKILIDFLEKDSPFNAVEINGKITDTLLTVLRTIEAKLESGEF